MPEDPFANASQLLAKLSVPSRSWFQRGPKRVLTDAELVTANEQLKLTQRKVLSLVAGSVAILQVACADVVFILYAALGRHWNIPTPAIEAWLAATVVQVIGVVLVITRSLFPTPKDSSV